MKTLVLLRHAKTEQPYSGQNDFDRELKDKGIADSIYKGQILKDKINNFDLILSSLAKRTVQTSELVAEKIGYKIGNILYKEEIYLASTRVLLGEISKIEDKYDTVLMVGHNPGTEYIAEYLSGEEIGFVNTSGAVCIEFNIDSWQEASQGNGKLLWTDFSKS